ncbi:MAG: primosomal protein N' [Rikenellaceae bacterium]|nr:primosomal protein N' [Rikenellaceae bacterium]
MRYADIVLPLAQPTYSFAIADGLELQCGDAVAVQFGPRNIYTGIVWRLHDVAPNVKRIKTVSRKLYPQPLLDSQQQQLWEWLADYYMCTLGEVMRMALPSLIKPQGASAEEFAAEEFQPRTESFVALRAEWQVEETLLAEIERIKRRAPKRSEALQAILTFSQKHDFQPFPRRLLECDAPLISALQKAGYIELSQRERVIESRHDLEPLLPQLTPAQQSVAEQIRQSQSEGRRVHLLRGITGSGKTEIYMTLIADVLARGGDVLLLVPEIALTSQLIERMRRVFGKRVTTYHSKLTALRRTEAYLRLTASEGGELVIGARSALLLPHRHLQLVIVDEEHDQSYKQSDTAPRYNGRDTAIYIASLRGAATLLGSATPSLESYANAIGGKYGYSELLERYGNATLPQIIISDTVRAVKRGERKIHFNHSLLNAIGDALQRGEQVMLFQNRRGFSPFVSCSDCGWTMRCPHCNVTLTLHNSTSRMECHYCGYTAQVPKSCPHCHTSHITPMGFGTEKIEQTIEQLFPTARVARLDRDTSTSESAYNRIIRDFENGDTDILVGTQMISKGFDFGRVSVVGILNADNLLNSPDFRASERAFQLIMQVAGRAGRRDDAPGVVVIQTSEPDNPVIGWVQRGDYEAMARSELHERHTFCYPPYSRLLRIVLRDEDLQLLRRCATQLSERLREKFGRRVVGPVSPPIDRLRGEYIIHLMIKIENGRSMARARELLGEAMRGISSRSEYKTVKILIDVDAQ